MIEMAKNSELITYKYDTNIDNIQNLYKEKRGDKVKSTVDKVISGKRYRKRFDDINDAIDYLNELNMRISKQSE